jgi:Uma2 family endonuclease
MATVPTPSRLPPAPAPQPPAVAEPLCVRIPTSALTLAGFRAWATSDAFPDNLRAAFLGEEIFLDMSNEDLDTHAFVKGEIARVVGTLNRELRLGVFMPDGVLVSNEAASVSNNPDASFFSHASLQTGRVRLVPRQGHQARYREVEGTPDWVLEVLSDGSVQKDTRQLREAYHRAGIPEYWLVDARGEAIAFQILYRRKRGYVAAPVRDGWQASRVFGRSFRMRRRRDESGLWEYTLEVRADN